MRSVSPAASTQVMSSEMDDGQRGRAAVPAQQHLTTHRPGQSKVYSKKLKPFKGTIHTKIKIQSLPPHVHAESLGKWGGAPFSFYIVKQWIEIERETEPDCTTSAAVYMPHRESHFKISFCLALNEKNKVAQLKTDESEGGTPPLITHRSIN